MNTLLRTVVQLIVGMVPSRALMFTYTVILKPKPLKSLANFLITLLIPKNVRIPEGFIAVNKKDSVVSGAITLGVYEESESLLFREKVTEGMTVIDVGANIGYFTLIAAMRVGRSVSRLRDILRRR